MTRTEKPIIPPVEPTVLIEGQPAVIAGRSDDDNHPVVISGEPTVLVAGHPAATYGGQAASLSGKPTVLVADRPAADE